MDRWTNRVAVVTGASAGIGADVCKMLSKNGMKVVAGARRIEKLEEMAKEFQNIFPYKIDLQNHEETKKMFEWIENHQDLGKVDVCIANAGVGPRGSLLEATVEDMKIMMDVNVIALNLCTQLSVKSMIKHNIDDGQIIFISSMGGHRVPQGSTVRFYCATKYAVTALIEGWRQELLALNGHLRVTSISPGLVKTEFLGSSMGDFEKAEATYDSLPHLLAEDITQQVKNVLETNKRVQIHDILMRPTKQSQ